MTRVPNNLAAQGIRSIGRGAAGRMQLWSRVTEGLKAAEGRSVMVNLTLRDQAWLLANMAQDNPDVFRAITEALGDHQRPKKYSPHDFALGKRLETAAREALDKEYPDDKSSGA